MPVGGNSCQFEFESSFGYFYDLSIHTAAAAQKLPQLLPGENRRNLCYGMTGGERLKCRKFQ